MPPPLGRPRPASDTALIVQGLPLRHLVPAARCDLPSVPGGLPAAGGPAVRVVCQLPGMSAVLAALGCGVRWSMNRPPLGMRNPLGDWFQGWMWPEAATKERMHATIRPETGDCHGYDLNLLEMAASATNLGACRSSRRARPCRPSCALVSATRSGGAEVSGFSFPTGYDRTRSNIPEHCSKPRRRHSEACCTRRLLQSAPQSVRHRPTDAAFTRRIRGGYGLADTPPS